MLKRDHMRGVDPPPNHRLSLLFCRDPPTSRIHMHCLNARLDRSSSTLVRPLDLWIVILADQAVPKLVVGIALRDVAFTFRRFVAT
jgi:hypothetical protein